MNGFYDILLFLFIFGAAAQGFNEFHVFGVTVPDNGLTMSQGSVTEYQSSTTPTTVDGFTSTNVLMSGLRILGSALLAVFTIIPLCISIFTMVGVDFWTAAVLSGFIQAPVWLVTIVAWYEWSTGRPIA